MDTFNRKTHWDNIYTTKELKDVSWYQATPTTSLNFIQNAGISNSAKIIDVGGGDSLLVDHLLQVGYTDITVVDISKTALKRAQLRLGELAKNVKWIVADAAEFIPTEKYDLWHDRAAFHFLINDQERNSHIKTIENNINDGGTLILATFSEHGPQKCSGIETKQYSEKTLTQLFSNGFEKTKCELVNHSTPFNTSQNFIFCGFRKLVS